jgi:predicted AAA+ superfamily ATPase
MEIVSLFPLSMAEVGGQRPAFLKAAFKGNVSKPATTIMGRNLVDAVLVGGYPEMLRRNCAERHQTWARHYIRAIVERDVRDTADIERLDQVPRPLRVWAQCSGQLTNFTQLGGQIGLDDKTTRKYVAILEQLFLVRRIQPWFRNHLSRLIKTPKIHFFDSGLLAALLGITAERVTADRKVLGRLLETFVFSELLKQIYWAEIRCTMHHYRDKDQDEVDVVIEDGTGTLIGIEVKAAPSVNSCDFKGLRKLKAACGDDFKLGLVLYGGETIVPFGNRLFAAPISCLRQ